MYRPDTSPTGGVVPSGKGRTPLDRVLEYAAEASRYDALLAAIPLALIGSLLVGRALGVPVTTSVGVGSTAALAVVAYGLFGAPPRDLTDADDPRSG